MQTHSAVGQQEHLTFKGNLKESRYGWLRLTPAYSVHLVEELLPQSRDKTARVLDPFCGTGTTALVCAENGIDCDTTDINPFLVWLANAKTQPYMAQESDSFIEQARKVGSAVRRKVEDTHWTPPIHQLGKWWDQATLKALAVAKAQIAAVSKDVSARVVDLLHVAFCRTVIESANVSFGHQSMSFKKASNLSPDLPFPDGDHAAFSSRWTRAVASMANAARSSIDRKPGIYLCDARELSSRLRANSYSCVITSPPYPNRMSYIRELRPYMYWLEYLKDGRSAGELDWKAIGGTWGCATSNVGKWQPEQKVDIPYKHFSGVLEKVAVHSQLLSRYIHKYFYDMTFHCRELYKVVKPRGVIHYIVGNSKFYDVLLPVEEIFEGLFQQAGFTDIRINRIRKRTSKKELFEYTVSATKP